MHEENVSVETERRIVGDPHHFICLVTTTFLGSSLFLSSAPSSPSFHYMITMRDSGWSHRVTPHAGHNWAGHKLVPYSFGANWKGPQGRWNPRDELGRCDPEAVVYRHCFFFFFFIFQAQEQIRLLCSKKQERSTHVERPEGGVQRERDAVPVLAEVWWDFILGLGEILSVLIITFPFSFEFIPFGVLWPVTKSSSPNTYLSKNSFSDVVGEEARPKRMKTE